MKVLCLCYRPKGWREIPFMRPMQRVVGHFEPFGIAMNVQMVDTDVEVEAALAGDYDVLLLHEMPLYEPAIDCGKPVIFLERLDGAQLRLSRKHLYRIRGVIKGYVFRDRTQYVREYDRAHIRILNEARVACRQPLYRDELPEASLNDADCNKVRVGYGFGAWDNVNGPIQTEIDFDAHRPIDVHFAGTVDYEDTEVEAHRRRALHAAKTWPYSRVASPGRQIATATYHRQILDSKTVLCPWGWGEASHREYEAWLLGAVVIKPDTDYVEAWPDMYRSGETYVACRPDFSDVHEKIDHVRRHWDDYRPMRERARRLVAEAHRAEHVAKRMSLLIKELVG